MSKTNVEKITKTITNRILVSLDKIYPNNHLVYLPNKKFLLEQLCPFCDDRDVDISNKQCSICHKCLFHCLETCNFFNFENIQMLNNYNDNKLFLAHKFDVDFVIPNFNLKYYFEEKYHS